MNNANTNTVVLVKGSEIVSLWTYLGADDVLMVSSNGREFLSLDGAREEVRQRLAAGWKVR